MGGVWPWWGLCFLFALGAAAESDIFSTVKGHDKVVICYWGTWANYRPQQGKFTPDMVDGDLCTHLIYTFAGLDNAKWAIKSLDAWLDLESDYGLAGFKKATDLRIKHPHLKVMIAIGGWNEGSTKYSHMAKDKVKRGKFVKSVVKFLEKHKFDGLDLDWEYPAKRGGVGADKQNFILLIKELKEAFAEHKFLLTAAIGAGKSTIDISYDVAAMYEHLDYVNVMCYDYHGKWDKKTGHNAPLRSRPNEYGNNLFLNVEYTIEYLMKKGAKPEKTVLGVPFYGRSFLLTDPNKNNMGDTARSTSFAGPLTREAGFLGYNEICMELSNKNSTWVEMWEICHMVPYMVRGDRWVGYDNEKSLRLKAEFAFDQSLGGVMTWSIETDDFKGLCGGGKYPLLRTLNKALSEREAGSITEEEDTCVPSDYVTHRGSTTSSSAVDSHNDHDHDNTFEWATVPSVTQEGGGGSSVCIQPNGPNPDPTDCSQFYLCAGGVPHVISCRPGTLYSPGLMTCDHTGNVACEATSTTTTTTTTAELEPSSTTEVKQGFASTTEVKPSSTTEWDGVPVFTTKKEPATTSKTTTTKSEPTSTKQSTTSVQSTTGVKSTTPSKSIIPYQTIHRTTSIKSTTPVKPTKKSTTPRKSTTTSYVPEVTVNTITEKSEIPLEDVNNDIGDPRVTNNEYITQRETTNHSMINTGVRAETVIIVILVILLLLVISVFLYCYRAKVRDYAEPFIPKVTLPKVRKPSTMALLQSCNLDKLSKINWPISHKSFSGKLPTFGRPRPNNSAPVPPPRQRRNAPVNPPLQYASNAPAPRLATIISRPLPRPPAPIPDVLPPLPPLPTESTPSRRMSITIGPPMGVTINGVTLVDSVPPPVPPHADYASCA